MAAAAPRCKRAGKDRKHGEGALTLAGAKEQFRSLLEKLTTQGREGDAAAFVEWVRETVGECAEDEDEQDDPLLLRIAAELRERVPPDANAPGETFTFADAGVNGDCSEAHTAHVDAFLFSDDAVEEMAQEGKMSRAYCCDCGSRNTKPLTFLSHSMSMVQLRHLYGSVLPDLDGLVVLDVGSRLGAVLYAGYVYSSAAKLVGVEMNAFFCNLQRDTVAKHGLGDRIEIVEGDVQAHAALFAQADVVVLNNVFEFFAPLQTQQTLWRFLRHALRPGCMLVTVPSLEESLEGAKSDVTLEGWVQREPLEPSGDEDCDSIFLYTTDPVD